MNHHKAADELATLGHPTRLSIFRYLMSQGRKGASPGEISTELQVAPNALTFHLNKLKMIGLIRCVREGRYLIYTPNYDEMRSLVDFLSANCCKQKLAPKKAKPKIPISI